DNGSWSDIPGPVEYIRNDTAGNTKSFSTNISTATSDAVNDKVLVFLRWKYYFISGASSARAQLRVDDILVSSVPLVVPPSHALLSFTLINADTDQDIRTLTSNDTINLAL